MKKFINAARVVSLVVFAAPSLRALCGLLLISDAKSSTRSSPTASSRSTANNNPPQSSGSTTHQTNWRAYWAATLRDSAEDVVPRRLGVTAIWSFAARRQSSTSTSRTARATEPPRTTAIGRDFKRIEEHFGNRRNTWADFDTWSRRTLERHQGHHRLRAQPHDVGQRA
jgi:hypothetical protein